MCNHFTVQTTCKNLVSELSRAFGTVPKGMIDEDESTSNVNLFSFSSVGIPFMCQEAILMQIIGR